MFKNIIKYLEWQLSGSADIYNNCTEFNKSFPNNKKDCSSFSPPRVSIRDAFYLKYFNICLQNCVNYNTLQLNLNCVNVVIKQMPSSIQSKILDAIITVHTNYYMPFLQKQLDKNNKEL
jgi:hypothetical protein